MPASSRHRKRVRFVPFEREIPPVENVFDSSRNIRRNIRYAQETRSIRDVFGFSENKTPHRRPRRILDFHGESKRRRIEGTAKTTNKRIKNGGQLALALENSVQLTSESFESNTLKKNARCAFRANGDNGAIKQNARTIIPRASIFHGRR